MSSNTKKVKVPDIGGATDVDVIELFVKSGDKIETDQSLITLEGDKASMDVPSPAAGTVDEVSVKVGDKVSEGSLILTLKTEEAAEEKEEKEKKEEEGKEKAEKEKEEEKEEKKKEEKEGEKKKKKKEKEKEEKEKEEEKKEKKKEEKEEEKKTEEVEEEGDIHAGPGVRRIAREFGIDLQKIQGTGQKNRILKEDVQKYVKQKLQQAETGMGMPAAPKVDFSKFGEIEKQDLSKIKKLSGANLHRNWVSIPHVTQFGEADITELEAFRQEQKKSAEKQGFKLTPLVFIMKAAVAALKVYPIFNSSLSSNGEQLIMKKYFHIGVAVDTPNGLVVPVIRDVDKKGLFELAKELGEISKKAREKGLSLTDMQGGCFSISSLGGIGGTAFTPIINAPEVAILGVSQTYKKPVYQTYGEFVPRLMLPLSLSYDHRVVDGADGARFMVYLSKRLQDIRTLLL